MENAIPHHLACRFEVSGTGCWNWTQHRCRQGYGRIRVAGHMKQAHRIVYECAVGPVPDGLVLDHLCRNKGCVNPDHLEPVTFTENVLRGISFAAENARKTHCANGHALDAGNTYITKGRRQCRACNRAAVAAYRTRRVAA